MTARKKETLTALVALLVIAMLFLPIFCQSFPDGSRVWYSFADGIHMNIAENQWFWPSWN